MLRYSFLLDRAKSRHGKKSKSNKVRFKERETPISIVTGKEMP